MKLSFAILPILVLLVALITSTAGQKPEATSSTDDQEPQASNPPAVLAEPIAATEPDLVVTMDRVLRPLFNDLKKEIGTKTQSSDVNFDNVLKDSLIMSEILARIHQWPDIAKFDSAKSRIEYAEAQKGLAIKEAQSDASSIYRAAIKKDYESAQKNFVSMTKNCNTCHQKNKSSWAPVLLKP